MCAFSRLPKLNSKAEKHMLAVLKERLLIANTWLRNAEEALGLHLGLLIKWSNHK